MLTKVALGNWNKFCVQHLFNSSVSGENWGGGGLPTVLFFFFLYCLFGANLESKYNCRVDDLQGQLNTLRPS